MVTAVPQLTQKLALTGKFLPHARIYSQSVADARRRGKTVILSGLPVCNPGTRKLREPLVAEEAPLKRFGQHAGIIKPMPNPFPRPLPIASERPFPRPLPLSFNEFVEIIKNTQPALIIYRFLHFRRKG